MAKTNKKTTPGVKITAKKLTARPNVTKGREAKPKRAKISGKPKAISKSKVTVGRSLPAFSLAATGESTVDLARLKGRTVVLYFYPKDSTPGCTLEGKDFTRLHEQFKGAGAEVFGISRDTMKSHEKFKAAQNYSIDLLSDEDEKLCALFGVIKMKNMYGRQVRGIERSTFVIDKEGTLKKEWRGVRVAGHAEEVLEFVRSL